MFLVASRTGTILHDICLVQSVMGVTRFAFLVDWIESDPVSESFFHNRAKLLRRERPAGHQRSVMTLGAIVTELGMAAGNFPGAEKSLAAACLKNPNGKQPTDN